MGLHSLPVSWPEATHSWSLQALWWGYWWAPKGLMPTCTCQYPCCQSHCPWSRLLLTHASAGDSQMLTGRSRSAFRGVTTPFPWVVILTRFCLCPPCLFSPVLWKFCNQIPLPFKVRCPKDPQWLCQISRLGSLIWDLELS